MVDVVAGSSRNVTSAAVWAVVRWRLCGLWAGQWPWSRLWIISAGLQR